MNYDEDVKIDEDALDIEWLEQGSLAMRYAQYQIECDSKVRQLEEKKRVIRSELILAVNEEPKNTVGKDKPNAADIEAYYRTQLSYQGITERLNNARTEAEYAKVASDEIRYTRKKALENLVALYGQQYFAGPKTPRDLKSERQKRVDEGVSKSLRRKNK